jgi:hypothetical protein
VLKLAALAALVVALVVVFDVDGSDVRTGAHTVRSGVTTILRSANERGDEDRQDADPEENAEGNEGSEP